MMAICRWFFFVTIHSFVMWGMLWLGSLLNLHIYLGGFWVFLSVCSLKYLEGVFSVLLLGFLYDSLMNEPYFGVYACLLAASTLIFDVRFLKNVGFSRIRIHSFVFNFAFHFMYLMGQLWVHGLCLKSIIYYMPSMIIVSGFVSFLSPLWIKFHQKYFL